MLRTTRQTPVAVPLAQRDLIVLRVQQEDGRRWLSCRFDRRGADDLGITRRAVDLVFDLEHPLRLVGGRECFHFLFEHHRAQEIVLRQQQFRFAVTVHIRRRQPGLRNRAAGRRHVLFIETAVRLFAATL